MKTKNKKITINNKQKYLDGARNVFVQLWKNEMKDVPILANDMELLNGIADSETRSLLVLMLLKAAIDPTRPGVPVEIEHVIGTDRLRVQFTPCDAEPTILPKLAVIQDNAMGYKIRNYIERAHAASIKYSAYYHVFSFLMDRVKTYKDLYALLPGAPILWKAMGQQWPDVPKSLKPDKNGKTKHAVDELNSMVTSLAFILGQRRLFIDVPIENRIKIIGDSWKK